MIISHSKVASKVINLHKMTVAILKHALHNYIFFESFFTQVCQENCNDGPLPFFYSFFFF